MNLFDEIMPAQPDKVNLYAPYFMKAMAKRTVLPKAITLYQKGGLGGHRAIEGGEQIPYSINWVVQNLPGDLTRCTIIFDENSDLTYELNLANSDLIGYLIDWLINIRDTNTPDFSQEFYHKLMKMEVA
jgi:hypothetical protein